MKAECVEDILGMARQHDSKKFSCAADLLVFRTREGSNPPSSSRRPPKEPVLLFCLLLCACVSLFSLLCPRRFPCPRRFVFPVCRAVAPSPRSAADRCPLAPANTAELLTVPAPHKHRPHTHTPSMSQLANPTEDQRWRAAGLVPVLLHSTPSHPLFVSFTRGRKGGSAASASHKATHAAAETHAHGRAQGHQQHPGAVPNGASVELSDLTRPPSFDWPMDSNELRPSKPQSQGKKREQGKAASIPGSVLNLNTCVCVCLPLRVCLNVVRSRSGRSLASVNQLGRA
jgi:hypothetical protein